MVYSTLSPGRTVAIFGGTWQWVHGAAAHGAMLPQIAQMPIQVKPSQDSFLDTRFKIDSATFKHVFVCHGWKALLFTRPMFFDVALDVALLIHPEWPTLVQPDFSSLQKPTNKWRERERCLTTKSKIYHDRYVVMIEVDVDKWRLSSRVFNISEAI